MAKKITQYPASAGNPDVTSLIDISEFDGSIYTSKKLTISQLIDFLNTNLNLGSSFTFKNNTGDTISKGMAVELSGASGLDLPEIALLSSSFSNVGLSQIFIANEDILNGNSGNFIQNGFLDNWYTIGLTLGQKIFWDVASQSLTTVGTNLDQVFVGIVTVVDANGQLFVSPTRGTRTLTSQLINDGSDTVNPFVTALDIANFIDGSGTLDYVAVWTPDGATLGIGTIQDNGQTASIGSAPNPTINLYIFSLKDYGINVENDKAIGNAFGVHSSAYGIGKSNGVGVYGFANGSTISDIGVEGEANGIGPLCIGIKGTSQSNTLSVGGKFLAQGAGSKYSVQLQDGSEGIGKVLTSITADGKSNWQTPVVPTLTSELTNDGEDGLNPFITALDIPTFASADKMVTVGRNSTGSTLYKGTIVYILGSTGNRPNFVKARADVEATSAGTFGVIEFDILNNADGNCVTIGAIDNLDTRSTATHPFTSDTLVDGDTIYLSPTTAGYITNVKPTAPDHLVYMGKVVETSPTNGTIVYRIQNGYELQELHNVAISSVTNNDILQYETSTSLWKNKAIPTASGSVNGYLSSTDWNTFNNKVATTRTLTINGTAQDLSADRSWTVTASSGIWGIANSSGVYTYYATYQLAVAAATSGQTIEMFGSITESTANHILKNGVNINYNGYTLTFTTGFGIIDNGVSCEVQLLNGEVKKGVSGQYVITVSNSATIIRGNVLINSSVAGSYGLYGPATVYGLRFKGYNCLILYSVSVKGKAYGVTINCIGGSAFIYGEIYKSIINSTSVDNYAFQYATVIANCSGVINGYVSFYMQGTQIRNSSFTNLTSITCEFASQDDNFIDNCYFRASASVFATGNAQGKGLMSNTKISGVSYLWQAAGYIINMDKCTLISDTYWNFYLCNGATFNFCTFIVRDTVNSFQDLVSGTVKLNNCNFQLFSAAAYPVYGASAKNFTASNNTYNTTNFQLNMTNLQTYIADLVGNQRLN